MSFTGIRRHIRFFQSLTTEELSFFTEAWLLLLKLGITTPLKAADLQLIEERSICDSVCPSDTALDNQINLAVLRAARYHFFNSSADMVSAAGTIMRRKLLRTAES